MLHTLSTQEILVFIGIAATSVYFLALFLDTHLAGLAFIIELVFHRTLTFRNVPFYSTLFFAALQTTYQTYHKIHLFYSLLLFCIVEFARDVFCS